MSNLILFSNPDILTNIARYSTAPLTNVNTSLREAVMINMGLHYPFWNVNLDECPDMEELVNAYMRYAALIGDWSAFQLIVATHHDQYMMLQDAFKLALQGNREDLARWIYNNFMLPVITDSNDPYDFETEDNIIYMLDNPINRVNMMDILDRIGPFDLESGNVPANVRQFLAVNSDARDILAEHLYSIHVHEYEGDYPSDLQAYTEEEVENGIRPIAIANPYDPQNAYIAHNRNVRLGSLLSLDVPLIPSVYHVILDLLPSARSVRLPDSPIYKLLFPEYASYPDNYEPYDDVDAVVYALVTGADLPDIECPKQE